MLSCSTKNSQMEMTKGICPSHEPRRVHKGMFKKSTETRNYLCFFFQLMKRAKIKMSYFMSNSKQVVWWLVTYMK